MLHFDAFANKRCFLRAAKTSKCSILEEEVEFLGQWIMPHGAALVKEKVQAVRNWERPRIIKDVRLFLGFANYYHRFVPRYTEVAAPLTYLTMKDVEITWGPPQQ